MFGGLYSAATGVEASSQNHQVVAQNLANINTPGYRRAFLVIESFEGVLQNAGQGLLGANPAEVATDFSSGPVQFTGNRFDIALPDNGFFVVQGPNGPLYTKNGTFNLDPTGQLVTQTGLPVLGQGGPLNLPAGETMKVLPNGEVFAGDTPVGQLQIVGFNDLSVLRRAGSTLFDAGGAAAQPIQARVLQGYREGSNVHSVTELVHMIAGARNHQAATHAMRAISDAIQHQTDPGA